MLWPAVAGPRVLLPQLGIGVILVFVALRQPEERRHWRTVAAATLVGLCAVSYALRYHETTRAPLPDDFARSEHTELVAFVDRATAPNDVFISMAPRTFAFLTRRTASIYDKRLSLDEQWRYFESIHATYLVARKDVDETDSAYLARMISTYPDRFWLAFSNATYHVYHIVPAGAR